MGFMDKAKKLAEQAQKEAKDGTLKQRAKTLAEQAQAKLDDVQTQFNERQQTGAAGSTPPPAPAAEAPVAPTPAPPVPPSGDASGVDRPDDAAPKLTSGDPLAG